MAALSLRVHRTRCRYRQGTARVVVSTCSVGLVRLLVVVCSRHHPALAEGLECVLIVSQTVAGLARAR